MRFIQLWILPRERGLPPGVEQKVFNAEDRTDRWLKAISGDGGDAVLVHQDAHVLVSRLGAGLALTHELGEDRGAYLYVIEGDVTAEGERMVTGSAAQVTGVEEVTVEAASDSELILVDVSLTS
jgi:redox-sensitive bicupin YhaK (pirin superfamily)